MAVLFNLGHDELEDIPLTLEGEALKIERLLPDGTRASCEFTAEGKTVRICDTLPAVTPTVLFLKLK